jgi:uncharacterized protein
MRYRHFFLGGLLIAALISQHTAAHALDSLDERGPMAAEKSEKASKPLPPLIYPVYFFQKYLSGADSDRCPMHPSCSAYCVDALRKHGALLGWIMTCDRLIRCGRDELKRSPPVRVNGKPRCYDPVANNDFWWHR